MKNKGLKVVEIRQYKDEGKLYIFKTITQFHSQPACSQARKEKTM